MRERCHLSLALADYFGQYADSIADRGMADLRKYSCRIGYYQAGGLTPLGLRPFAQLIQRALGAVLSLDETHSPVLISYRLIIEDEVGLEFQERRWRLGALHKACQRSFETPFLMRKSNFTLFSYRSY